MCVMLSSLISILSGAPSAGSTLDTFSSAVNEFELFPSLSHLIFMCLPPAPLTAVEGCGSLLI